MVSSVSLPFEVAPQYVTLHMPPSDGRRIVINRTTFFVFEQAMFFEQAIFDCSGWVSCCVQLNYLCDWLNYWQNSPLVGCIDLFSIFQSQVSINAAGCEYRGCIMWLRKMCSMHILFISILHIFVCTDGHFQSHFSDHVIFKAQLEIARSQQFMEI